MLLRYQFLLLLWCTLLTRAAAQSATSAAVSTLAGTAGSKGSADGAGAAARFSRPMGVAVDAGGNVYVADTDNHVIRKITAAGQVSTLAGTAGQKGFADGIGPAARLFNPVGLALDAQGTLYVADTGNNVIRKITPDGAISTLAGAAGLPGTADGVGAAARFNQPHALAVDAAGNVLVADTYNHTVRRISPAGAVTTLAGTPKRIGSLDGPGTAAGFRYPYGIAVEASGALYVADNGNMTVRRIGADGTVSTLAGKVRKFGNADGTGAEARFGAPSGMALGASGTLYVADAAGMVVRQINPATGQVGTLAGDANSPGSADGSAAAARFKSPLGLAIGPGGAVYVADGRNHTVRVIR
ncbi:hypothetical protein F0P96_06685 [Hymenobacter busanensis]|uniref:Uncharacterized protein n=1 Tax=Hymenobacter busanensis TaxID=2607656 RepID=A0A7L4ZZU9_9BACT|nr:NHL repeat-containing protein [Hymenobacter busanensis]KAA9338513.1 hypothetical protein F0P96_06685 [Hymenobacter busanensis]QHJ09059.1 hypothetical protein GUY19_17915 [Hymenobacter busanensis]